MDIPGIIQSKTSPPWQIKLATVLIGLSWATTVTLVVQSTVQHPGTGGARMIYLGMGFWTFVLAFALRRMWRRGAIVHGFLRVLSLAFGILYLGTDLFVLSLDLVERLDSLRNILDNAVAAFFITGPLIAAGLLLGSSATRSWCNRELVRPQSPGRAQPEPPLDTRIGDPPPRLSNLDDAPPPG